MRKYVSAMTVTQIDYTGSATDTSLSVMDHLLFTDQLHRELCKGYAWTVGRCNVLSGRLGTLGCCWHIFRDSCGIQVID